ncbi:MAG TPA: molybdenum cofactor guanylyltransferase MobA [Nevskiaceae bacterium]|nr:molybdenum cofactor guanylyltransferase MobA [Nevskiaceae bacterium]
MNGFSCTGGILAGGEGRRFGGVDKGLVVFHDRPLVRWTFEALRPQVDDVLISANRHLDQYAALGARVVTDATGGGHPGPFAGIVRLLEAAPGDWLLCVPCDAVRLPDDLATHLHACARDHAAEIVALHDGAELHPLFCLIRTTLAADARACFDAGERAPREWFRRHALALLQGPAPLNLNTPADLAALELAG